MPRVERVLFICTANQCRSPVAAALLAQRVGSVDLDVEVSSAGLLPGGVGAAAGVIAAAGSAGLDLSNHLSQQVTPQLLNEAELILGMERSQVREVVLSDPSLWGRTFTLRELVRKASEIGARREDESLPSWLEVVADGRRHADLLGVSTADDVVDPMGGPPNAYTEMFRQLEVLIGDLARFVWAMAQLRRAQP